MVVEFVLIRGELSPTAVRKLARWDMIYGISAGALLAIGLLRVFYFEKGAGSPPGSGRRPTPRASRRCAA